MQNLFDKVMRKFSVRNKSHHGVIFRRSNANPLQAKYPWNKTSGKPPTTDTPDVPAGRCITAAGVRSTPSSSSMSNTLPIWLHQQFQIVDDDVPTESSELQVETEEECLPLLQGELLPRENDAIVTSLRREAHARFLRQSLGRLPAGFAALDASRPWMLYWCLTGLSVLGVDVRPYRER